MTVSSLMDYFKTCCVIKLLMSRAIPWINIDIKESESNAESGKKFQEHLNQCLSLDVPVFACTSTTSDEIICLIKCIAALSIGIKATF